MDKKINKFISFILVLSFLSSCSVEPQAIAYNEDQCSACKMMISEQQFGAELVTTKGKIYKYDAIECLISEFTKNGASHYAHILVTDYSKPGNFINAFSSTFLISPLRPSPMGENISAYESPMQIEKEFQNSDSQILNWVQLIDYLDAGKGISND